MPVLLFLLLANQSVLQCLMFPLRSFLQCPPPPKCSLFPASPAFSRTRAPQSGFLSISLLGPQRLAQRVVRSPTTPTPPCQPTVLLRLPGAATRGKREALPTEHSTRKHKGAKSRARARRKQMPHRFPSRIRVALCQGMPGQYGQGSSGSGPHGVPAEGGEGGRGCTAPDSSAFSAP